MKDFTDHLEFLAKSAKDTLESHQLVQTTRKEFLEKGLTGVEIFEIDRFNANFVTVLHASDDHLFHLFKKSYKKPYFLTISSLRIKGTELNWFFMKMTKNVWSMEKDTIKDLFIDQDTFILTELEYFFKEIKINEIRAKGTLSEELAQRITKDTGKGVLIDKLVIVDRSMDFFTPLSVEFDSKRVETQMMNILLSDLDETQKLDTLLQFYLLSLQTDRDLTVVKREMVYTFGEKMLAYFHFIEKLHKAKNEKDLNIVEFCRGDFDQTKSNVVLFLGGVCQKELEQLKDFVVLTTSVLDSSYLSKIIR